MILAAGLAATASISIADSDDRGGWGDRGGYGDSDDRGGYGGRGGDSDDRGGYGGRGGDSDDRGGYRERGEGGGRSVAPVNNKQYADECGACHFAYQPGLLPARSWERLMGSLNDHFGENAELDNATRQTLTDYLVNNAGDHSNYRRSQQLMDSLRRDDAPLRITEIPYFKREHRKISNRILQHEKVGSLSNCNACHRTAAQGSFEEGGINIPGYGRWED